CVAMLLSTLFEGFVWDALSASGMALALLGMGLALRSRQKK
ncbi:MAG: EamA family transporter, partial [Erythrobacter sp.]|nr:EamA family transporter [Erythrobacter sp.]